MKFKETDFMKRNLKELIGKMTLAEKAGLCSGLDFWHTKPVPRLGIPSVMVSDGPSGLRKQDMAGDHLGVNDSIKAVCFPSGCLTACSFDTELMRGMGEILGDECQAEDVSVILGPAINIKRSPLCGRNFEYLSEDPFLAGKLSAAYVKGVQSKNVGTSVKHFAANSQEFRRMSCSSNIDERTLREIYLPAFEETVKEGKPDTIMASYNKVNGTFAVESKFLLTDLLRKEWGFDGFVVSDWGAVNDRVTGLKAGLDLEMPFSGGDTDKQIVQAVKSGKLSESVLDKAVERILRIVFKFTDSRMPGNFDKKAHQAEAAKIAQESMVLLKNESNLLPLKKKDVADILFVGAFAKTPRYEGGGSSHINAWKVNSFLDAAKEAGLSVKHLAGYDLKENKAKDKALLEEAVKAAKKAKIVVIFAGLPDSYESEGYDREHMKMPQNQDALIEEIAKVQKNVVVVLHNGSPVEMPWACKVKAILESYLAGGGVGIAQFNLLFGEANPCGKLAETFPLKLEDNPSYLNFPGNGKDVNYAEGIFVGYRYYDKKNMQVLFPFGHGLSYTKFEYSDLRLSAKKITDAETLEVSLKVKNIGRREGKEIVQIYVAPKSPYREMRAQKELKAFAKVSLKAGETKTVKITLAKRAFAMWSTALNDWFVPSGEYEILAAASSRDVRLCKSVSVASTQKIPLKVEPNTVLEELLEDETAHEFAKPIFAAALKGMSDDSERGESSKAAVSDEMILGMMKSMPLRSLRSFSPMSDADIAKIIEDINKKLS